MKTTADPAELREIHLVRGYKHPRIALTQLRHVVQQFLVHLKLRRYRLGIHLVGPRKITRLNARFLHHDGTTDVIAFDYRSEAPHLDLHGEIFVCITEVLHQACHYHTPRSAELVRVILHGILHLRGYRDSSTPERHRMKSAENRWLRRLRTEMDLETLLPDG